MTLSGLLAGVQDDAALAAAVAQARADAATQLEIGGPVAVHPLLAAIVAAPPDSAAPGARCSR